MGFLDKTLGSSFQYASISLIGNAITATVCIPKGTSYRNVISEWLPENLWSVRWSNVVRECRKNGQPFANSENKPTLEDAQKDTQRFIDSLEKKETNVELSADDVAIIAEIERLIKTNIDGQAGVDRSLQTASANPERVAKLNKIDEGGMEEWENLSQKLEKIEVNDDEIISAVAETARAIVNQQRIRNFLNEMQSHLQGKGI